MGKAKERAAREEAKKAEARDDFTRLVRHAKSLKLESTWEDIKPELESHSAYKDVSLVTNLQECCNDDDVLHRLVSSSMSCLLPCAQTLSLQHLHNMVVAVISVGHVPQLPVSG